MNKLIKSSTVKTAISFVSGNILVAIIGGVSTIIYGKWISPLQLGEFNKYGIITGYLSIGIIFVDAAFQRHFPYLIGRDKLNEALEIAAVANWWFKKLFQIGTLIFLSLATISIVNNNMIAFWGYIAQIFSYGLMTYGLYLSTLYRTNKDFGKLNKNMIFTAITGFITLPFVYFFNYIGFANRRILQDGINFFLLYKHSPFKIKSKYDPKKLVDLFKVSLPLQIPVYLDTKLLVATTSLFIVKTQGEKALGLYTMALTLSGFLLIFSRSINQIVNTKIMLKFGSNGSIKQSFKEIVKPVIILVLIGILMTIAFIIAIEYGINLFLPRYSESVLIAKILSIELILSLARTPFTLFASNLMYRSLFIQRMAKFILTVLLLFLFHNTLVEIASVIIIANFLNVVFGYYRLINYIKNTKHENSSC